ncbi:hypothetical protein M0805_005077 [Coniferiporia weirii]|nr:hypothetical protein M0805_005077 [Coniferiporia weirii]
MRLLTWNINGVRTLPLYHPWNALKTGENILNELGADIICFQEMKSSRQALDKSFALPESYDAFFSFPTIKGGYSGVAVFTKASSAVPLKAEEGLSGRLHSGLKPPLSQEERISTAYPLAHELKLVEDEAGRTHNDLLELDKEGRALILDFGLFVLINLYCPNETSDERLPYKMNFHLLLAERVRRLVEVDKREVIVTGDINICAAPIDHCDGELASNKEDFWVHPARKWFHEWLAPLGPMVDVVRGCWPERKGMFTCWNQKISARVTNYGTRIDYFLLTKGLLPWFDHGDILPLIKGSDHCPVYIDLHDEIVTETGEKIFLKDMVKMSGEKRDPPRLASRYWNEYSGKQKLLSSFFGNGKKGSATSNMATTPPTAIASSTDDSPVLVPTESFGVNSNAAICEAEAPGKQNQAKTPEETAPDSAEAVHRHSEPSPPTSSIPSNLTTSSSSKLPAAESSSMSRASSISTPGPSKRKKMQANSNYSAQSNKKTKKSASVPKAKEKPTGQKKISSFFPTPTPKTEDELAFGAPSSVSAQTHEIIDVDGLIGDSDDFMPSSSQLSLSVPGSSQNEDGKNAHAWSTLFARVEPPKCIVHGEPTRQFTVNKPGPNKGKTFFICSRPVGPGYDAGKDRRLREEVDPQYRCNYFKWSSEVKMTALREAEKKKK